MSIDTTIDRITNKIMSLISHYKDILNKIKMSNVLLNPVNIYNIKKDMLKIDINNLNKSILNIITLNKMNLYRLENNYILTNPKMLYEKNKDKLIYNINKLELLNPMNALKRGYSIIKKENKCIENIKKLNINDKIDIYVSDGCITSLITDIKEN